MIAYLLPEIICFILGVLFLFTSFGRPKQENLYRLAMILSFVNVLAVAYTMQLNGTFFYGSYRVDLFSQSVKLLLAIGLFFVIFMSDSRSEAHIRKNYPEFLFFLFSANLGMMMLSSAVEFITLFLSLELSSYSMFILTGFLRDRKMSVEAAVKYLFIGAVASAVTLYGYSLMFGSFSDTSLLTMRHGVQSIARDAMLFTGFIFFLSAFFFKLAMLPFSFWAPDVYEGADTSVVTYIATVSKVAAVAVLLRIFMYFAPVLADLEKVLLVLAVLTMTLGNLLAVQQNDIKRLLAYSSIAQAGYMMVGVAITTESAASATLFYVFSYLIMNFTVFLVADLLIKEQGATDLGILKGLSQRSPLLALALLLALLSLGGVPPFVGFTGKWMIFSAAITKGYLALVLIAFLNSVVSVYYYLLVARQAYLLAPDRTEAFVMSGAVRLYSYFAIVFIIAMGFYPTAMLNWTEQAVRYLITG